MTSRTDERMAPPNRPRSIFNVKVQLFSVLSMTSSPADRVQTLTAPFAAVVMAGLLYTYSVTSIRAAKLNAQRHREADGGQLDMRKESLRRHGRLEKVDGTRDLELMMGAGKYKGNDASSGGSKAMELGEEPTARGKTAEALNKMKTGKGQ